uniref:insulin-like growth factor-binding protein 7 n=1 Tax=Myxine glutinosa TaxID=7769 RepID=UPI00358F912A
MKIFLLSLLFVAWAVDRASATTKSGKNGARRTKVSKRSCQTCDLSKCPPLALEGCPQGELKDHCGCCQVCAHVEGEPCGGRNRRYGRCASGYQCRRPEQEVDQRRVKGVCTCKAAYPVCGSDGVTYSTTCELLAASHRSDGQGHGTILQASKGFCEKGPSFVTKPREVWNITGGQIFLTCEVIGIPTPLVTWVKLPRIGSDAKVEMLPGDRENLAVQTRGGPEKHEVTGWVLINPLRDEDDGEYECQAKNKGGRVSAMGQIHVVSSLADIPTDTKLETEEEL